MELFFDTDGVSRRFENMFGIKDAPKEWGWMNADHWKFLDANPNILQNAMKHDEMLNLINSLIGRYEITMLTNQCGKIDREYHTFKFFRKNFKKGYNVIFTSNFQEKVDIITERQCFLVDDYPFMYKQNGFEKVKNKVILMERNWNKKERNKFQFTYNDEKDIIKDLNGKIFNGFESFIYSQIKKKRK